MFNLRLKSWLRPLLARYNTPAHRVIGQAMGRNRGLLAVAFVSNLLAASLEGLTLGLLFLALGAMGGDLPPLPGWLADLMPGLARLANRGGQNVFLPLIGLAVGMQVLRSTLTYLNLVSVKYLSARVQTQMTETVFNRIISFSFPCSSRYKVGDLTDYISSAAFTVDRQITLWSGLLGGSLLMLAYGATLLSLSLPLSIVALGLALGLVGLQRRLLPRIAGLSSRLAQGQAEVSKQVVEGIQALRVVHTFGRQRPAMEGVRQLQGEVQRLLQKQAWVMHILGPVNSALTMVILGGLLGAGALLINGDILLPALGTFVVALNRFSVQLQNLMGTVNELAENSGRIQRLGEILRTTDKQFTRTGGERFGGLTQGIVFDQVTLQYEGVSTPTLVEVSLKLPKNSVTALVGESGAGKSSLVDLLIGLYEPTAGAVLVDGLDLRDYSLESWRARLGVVSQDTFVFNHSIFENIRYGRPEATVAEVRQAACLAQADGFIETLPQGYDTVVGERGYRLSGGQRQRLALARAILKQPELLILDEATSALDSQSERLVQQALEQFEDNRTVVVIAHRLSTIVHADQIVVLEQGRVVEQGTHGQLLALNGRYAGAWQMQTVGWSRLRSS